MSYTPSPELRKLIDRLLEEGGLGRVETSRLEELLKDRQALRYYTEVMAQESMMAAALDGLAVEAPVCRPVLRFPWRPVALAAAACVVFGLGFFSGRRALPDSGPVAGKRAMVQVTGVMGVEWEPGADPGFVAGAATAQRVAFRSGLVELTYASGVRVTLEGPADYSVTDATSGSLSAGKLVAYVPAGAEGFSVGYAKGRVVDLGTEFAMDVSQDGRAELGVFDGEVALHLPGEAPKPLFESQAVMHDESATDRLKAIPLDREKFVRRLPARDFRWALSAGGPQQIEFDVTHLLWKPSRYRAIFKWIEGYDAVRLHDVELRLDGRPVATDGHEGVTGVLAMVHDNLFELEVKPGRFARGRWTLHATIEPYPREHGLAGYSGPVASQGILQFEEGLVSKAEPADFIGRWSYHYVGAHYIREFHADGTVTLTKDGKAEPESFANSRWRVEKGVLRVFIPDKNVEELHVLRDRRTLIFISNSYDNAEKLEDG